MYGQKLGVHSSVHAYLSVCLELAIQGGGGEGLLYSPPDITTSSSERTVRLAEHLQVRKDPYLLS